MTFDLWLLVAAIPAAFIAIYLAGWWYRDCPRWFLGCACRDDLPGPDAVPATGQDHRAGEFDDEDWQEPQSRWRAELVREPGTDDDADQLTAEWHGDSLKSLQRRHPSMLIPDSPGQRHSSVIVDLDSYPGDVFGDWWAGLDGLERECMLVHDLVVREAREWAVIKAETREMCAA